MNFSNTFLMKSKLCTLSTHFNHIPQLTIKKYISYTLMDLSKNCHYQSFSLRTDYFSILQIKMFEMYIIKLLGTDLQNSPSRALFIQALLMLHLHHSSSNLYVKRIIQPINSRPFLNRKSQGRPQNPIFLLLLFHSSH